MSKILPILCLSVGSICGADLFCASVASADVDAKLSIAVDGDTVHIPAGGTNWPGNKTVPVGVRVKGAGKTSTIITNASANGLFLINSRSWIQDIQLVGNVGSTSDDLINPTGQDWVLTNIYHRNISTVILLIRDQQNDVYGRGVISNCDLENSRMYLASPYINGMHKAHTNVITFGDTNAVYVEGVKFTNTFSTINSIDLNLGSRMVVRYCTFHNAFWATHGVQTDDRGVVSWEAYMNTHVFGTQAALAGIGSGTGVIFSNTVSGSASADAKKWWFEFKRSYDAFGTGGRADGHSNWDGNLTNGIAQAVGTHTGANNAATLTDGARSWTVNEFVITGWSRWIYNLTDGSKGQCTANTATTFTATLSGGTDNDWDTGDSYKITGGYPGRDQIGYGQDAFDWTSTFPNGAGPTQTLVPVYIWDNTGVTDPETDEVLLNDQGSPQSAFMMQEGREWLYEPKPGYTPLTYPHPLLGVSSAGVVGNAYGHTARVGSIRSP